MNRTHRRIIALAAAYVMGLQALLLPLSVAVGSLAAGTLCTSSGSANTPQGPAHRSDTGCPCAAGCGMQCGLHAAAAPPQHVFSLASFGAAASLPPPPVEQAPAPALRRPQLARGPPAA
jgi:hypothetical protein